MDITKELETDVLVVGAGNAASVAALAAHDLHTVVTRVAGQDGAAGEVVDQRHRESR